MDKELFIVRHAKSAWDTDAPDDFSRPLAKRGRNAAERVGDTLTRLNWLPDKIIVSPAKRALETCKQINIHVALDVRVEEDKRIYEASLQDLFAVLADVPDTTNKVMLIGHNPGLEQLLLHLAPTAERQKNGKLLTTGNVARIQIQGSWKEISTTKGHLLGHIRPKEMDDE